MKDFIISRDMIFFLLLKCSNKNVLSRMWAQFATNLILTVLTADTQESCDTPSMSTEASASLTCHVKHQHKGPQFKV